MNKSLCFVIPAYNEELSIPHLVNEITNHFPNATTIVINDCSTDSTSKIARNLGVVVLDLQNNLGIGGAVQTGLKYASEKNFDIAIQLDGDGQHIVTEVHGLLLEMSRQNADYAIGSRWIVDFGFKSTFSRRMGIKLLSSLVSKKTKLKFTDVTSGFRAMNSSVLNILSTTYEKDYPEVSAILAIAALDKKIIEVPVRMNERQHGESSITRLKSVYYMTLELITIFISRKPRS
jgi:glycosyltransferase involved in cell wall biosynthesis